MSVTVVILTFNEELNLPGALASVLGWADEVVVVDSGSSDATERIARESGARFQYHAFENYSRQRNYALHQLTIESEWILFLDADERVPDELRHEISSLLAANPRKNGYFLTFRMMWMGHPIRFGYRPTWLLRLCRRGTAGCDDRGINEHLTVSGETGYLKARLIHDDQNGLSRWITKHVRYSELEAAAQSRSSSEPTGSPFGTRAERTQWIRRHVWSRLPCLLRPWLYFLIRFVVRGGFLDGRAGFTFHFMHALWYQTLIDMRMRQMKESGPESRRAPVRRAVARAVADGPNPEEPPVSDGVLMPAVGDQVASAPPTSRSL